MLDPELQLLKRGLGVESESSPGDRLQHELQNAPLFTHAALIQAPQAFQQRGLLGSVVRQQGQGFPQTVDDPRMYVNTSAPCSAIVCGVQGSGKSHTVSCLLECSLITDKHIGNLPEPLSAIVFHFDEDNGDRPCEAAFLAAPCRDHPLPSAVRQVTVLVSPSNLKTRRKVYASIPNIDVQPLYLSGENLSAGRMLSMMGGDDIEHMPLYMHSALALLRKMGSDDFNYEAFKKQLFESKFTPIQRSMLRMRTNLLDSYLSDTAPTITSWFDHGKLVIIDLSDPFLDGTSVACLFEIVLGVFVEWRSHSRRSKKIIVLDEAHKYLTNSDNARLTKTLSSLIRQQRHLGVRIIVSTQEPTVIPATILDLSSYIICHRFSSPSWCAHLKQHVSLDNEGDTQLAPWIEEVMQLHTGEAIVFSPNAVAVKTGPSTGTGDAVARIGTGYLKILTRPRITLDGGFSVMAVDSEHPDGPPNVETPFPTPPDTPDRSKTTSPGPSKVPSNLPSTTSPIIAKTPSQVPSPTPKTLPPAPPAPPALPASPALPESSPKSKVLSHLASTSVSEAKPSSSSTAGTKSTQTTGHSNSAPAQVAEISAAPTAATKGPFWELIAILESFKAEGVTEPRRGQVSSRLRKMHPALSSRTKFKPYLVEARTGGYVKVGRFSAAARGGGSRWVSLP